MKMLPSERIHALARPIGHEWADLDGLRVCIHCGCAHDTNDALEKCVPVTPAPDIEAMEYAMHLHDLQCAVDRCMENGVEPFEIVHAFSEAMKERAAK